MQFINNNKVVFLFDHNLSKVTPSKDEQYWSIIDPRYYSNFVSIDGEMFYLKNKLSGRLLNELVGEAVSDYFNLPTVHSIPALFSHSDSENLEKESFVLLTKSFYNDDEHYINMTHFSDSQYYVFRKNNKSLSNLLLLTSFIDPIDNKVREINPEDIDKLLKDLKKMIVRDLVTNQHDRHISNFTFGCKEDHVRLMPLYDYEHSFEKFWEILPNYFSINFYGKSTDTELVRNDDEFQELFVQAMALDMPRLLEQVEETYQIKMSDQEKAHYNNQIFESQQMIKTRKLIK